MNDSSQIKESILEQFKKTGAKTAMDVRTEAIESFNRLGFPNAKNEEWKYTSVGRIINNNPGFGKNGNHSTLRNEDIQQFRIAGKDAMVLVFENGIFNKNLSDEIPADGKIIIRNLADSMQEANVMQYLGKIAPHGNEAFVALNTAFIKDGVFVDIPENFKADYSIHLLHINTTEKSDQVSTLRNLIVAGKNSELTIAETYHSLTDNSAGFTNSVTEITVGENAKLQYCKVQLESDYTSHINFTQVIQHRDSLFDIVTVSLGGSLVRNNLHIKLNDVNCTSHLYGLYILDADQLTDNHTLVDHAMPNCFSNELYKGIIGGKAVGVFNGKIFVRKDAQKTNAYQSNKNILLSDDAQMNTKPQLEIFADDVKCTHGATTGQLDEEALFYLRARGIGESSARALLNIAFAGDVLNNIKNEYLKENLMNLAESKLNRNEN